MKPFWLHKLNKKYATAKNKLACNHALVISLQRSYTTRLVPFLQRNKFTGSLEIIEAVDGYADDFSTGDSPLDKRTCACLLSHIKALEYARQKHWQCVMIFEDDIDFHPEFTTQLETAMAELPANWDMLWLGGMDQIRGVYYSKHLNRMISCWGAYGYLMRDKVLDYFISAMKQGRLPSDDYYRRNHSRFLSFKTKQPLVYHLPGFSDRQGKITNE